MSQDGKRLAQPPLIAGGGGADFVRGPAVACPVQNWGNRRSLTARPHGYQNRTSAKYIHTPPYKHPPLTSTPRPQTCCHRREAKPRKVQRVSSPKAVPCPSAPVQRSDQSCRAVGQALAPSTARHSVVATARLRLAVCFRGVQTKLLSAEQAKRAPAVCNSSPASAAVPPKRHPLRPYRHSSDLKKCA